MVESRDGAGKRITVPVYTQLGASHQASIRLEPGQGGHAGPRPLEATGATALPLPPTEGRGRGRGSNGQGCAFPYFRARVWTWLPTSLASSPQSNNLAWTSLGA